MSKQEHGARKADPPARLEVFRRRAQVLNLVRFRLMRSPQEVRPGSAGSSALNLCKSGAILEEIKRGERVLRSVQAVDQSFPHLAPLAWRDRS